MDIYSTITELATTLSPLLAVLLLYLYNKINANDKRITKLESKADKTGEILLKIQLDVQEIKTRLESLLKEHEK